MRWLVSVLLGTVVLVLLLANLVLFGYLAFEKSEVSRVSDTSCPQPGMGASGPYTPSEWHWVPPGRTCVYEGESFDGPSWTRVIAVTVMPAALAGAIVAWTAQARRAFAETRARLAVS